MKSFLEYEHTFPCQHCGECPVWLGYTNEAIDEKQLIENCIQSKCSIFGKEVKHYKEVKNYE